MSDEYNIYNGLDPYDPIKHKGHIEVLQCDKRVVTLMKGRRWGKTFTSSIWFLDKFLNGLMERADEIHKGNILPWSGIGLHRNAARRRIGEAIEAIVISPFDKQLSHARGLIEHRLHASGCADLLHPDDHLAHSERPAENWFLVDGAAGVIRYFVSTRPSKLVGSKASVIWLNESGLQSNDVWRNVKPLCWETDSWVIAEGTPELGEQSWFVKVAIAGLPADHERANPKIAKPRDDHKTFLGSSEEAYLDRVRDESKKDIEISGEDSVYTLTQIKGDWRAPAFLVFKWHHEKHLCNLVFDRGAYRLELSNRKIVLPHPDLVIGGIDWYKGDAPAGFLEVKVWYDTPLNQDFEDLRPLIVVDHEYTTPKSNYSDDAYFRKMLTGQNIRGVEGYYYDPSATATAETASRTGVILRETSNADKLGRVGMVARQLNYTEDIEPAMFVDKRCKRTAEQLSEFKRARDKEGNPKSDFVNYNDWFVDSLAYIVPNVQSYDIRGAGF